MRQSKLDEIIDKIVNKDDFTFTYFDRQKQNYICISPLTGLEGKGPTSDEAINSLGQQLIDIRLNQQDCPTNLIANRVTITERRGLRAIQLLDEIANCLELRPYEVLELLIYSKYADLYDAEPNRNKDEIIRAPEAIPNTHDTKRQGENYAESY